MSEDIIILSQSEYDTWDSFVAASCNGTIFHKSQWLMDSGMDFKIYGYFRNGSLIAGIPITYINKKGFSMAEHPPLTPYLGIIFAKNGVKYVTKISNEKEICINIIKRLKEDFNSIYIKFPPYFLDIQPFLWEGFTSSVGYTYMLKLDDLDDIWIGMDAKRRNDIKKAEKDGIYVEKSNDFQQTFALIDKTFDRQNIIANFKPVAFQHHDSLSKKNQCISFFAKNKDGKPIAVAYIVWDEKRSYYLLGGNDNEIRHHGASAMAIWEAIKFTKEELGLMEFDFEGSTIQTIEKFFRKFGGRLTPRFYVIWREIPLEVTSFGRHLTSSMLNRLKFWKNNTT